MLIKSLNARKKEIIKTRNPYVSIVKRGERKRRQQKQQIEDSVLWHHHTMTTIIQEALKELKDFEAEKNGEQNGRLE